VNVGLAVRPFLAVIRFVRFLQVMPQGHAQESPDPAFGRFKTLKRLAGEEPFEESLRQILGIIVTSAVASDAGVDGIPVGGAEFFESLAGAVRLGITGGQHDAPVGGGESRAFQGNDGRSGFFAAGRHGGRVFGNAGSRKPEDEAHACCQLDRKESGAG
jgi:hypothetical protein